MSFVRSASRLLASSTTLALASILTASPALADEADDSSNQDGRTIIVIGETQGYVATSSVTATKTDTPVKDVPQTISVVTREQLDDQAQRSMADVLRYIPGTTVGQGEGNRDQITLRGQNSTADFFLDGVRDDVQYYRSLYNIERVEVLKGPCAMIFGRGGGGGIINRVQKTPQGEVLFAEALASANSLGAYDLAADINVPVSAGAALRLNGFYEHLDNHRKSVDGERFAFNPYLAVELAEGWQLGASYEYVDDDRVPDRGVPSVECTGVGCIRAPLTNHRDTFFGIAGINRARLSARIGKLRLDGRLTDSLTWSSTLLYGDYDKYYTNIFPNSAVRLSDNTVEIDGYRDDTDRTNFIAQTNLVSDADLGGVKNKLLVGAEFGDQDTVNSRHVAATKGRVDVNALVFPTFAFPFPNQTRSTVSNVRFFSAYVQDQISIGEHVDIVGGLRYDRFEIEGRNLRTASPFARTDEKWSPRLGLILKPNPALSLYASYSRSFLPRSGDQFISLDATTQNLAPEKFTNYEVGAKWDVKPGLALTAALFQLDRTNTTTPDPANPTATILAGSTRTRGAEIGLAGKVTSRWQVSGGYTWQDGHLKGADMIRTAQVPRLQFALWNRYDFNRTAGLGLGIIHQSSQWAALHNPGVSTATRLQGFTRLDAAIFIQASERVELQVNVENLLDQKYFADAHNNNNLSVGVPVNARFTASVKF
ncbi:MAG: TonB-dependent siderophore receptor [Alphaproteobacteria bacterium]|nr:TonB-dependent siderophore receptor [Alphaproteobacteria bacterium]